MTLLDLVQDILASMDSDEVNSITDNPEAEQVARVVRTIYNHLTSQIDYPHHHSLFELNASGDNTKPIIMYRPSNVRTIEWIKYNKIRDGETDPNFQDVSFMPTHEFFDLMYMLNPSESSIDEATLTMNGADSITLIYRTDAAPDFFTTIDDNLFIFNSYDSQVDTTLQKNKTMCYGLLDAVTFSMTDSFEFDLDQKYMDLLVQESKALAWAELKQTQHQKAEAMARRGWNKTQPSGVIWNKYGRRK